MRDIGRTLRALATDPRVWGATLALVAWPAAGILTGVDLVAESATPLVYAYLFALDAVVPAFPGAAAFWVGFGAFCFAVAAALVAAFDRVRALGVPAKFRERLPVE